MSLRFTRRGVESKDDEGHVRTRWWREVDLFLPTVEGLALGFVELGQPGYGDTTVVVHRRVDRSLKQLVRHQLAAQRQEHGLFTGES